MHTYENASQHNTLIKEDMADPSSQEEIPNVTRTLNTYTFSLPTMEV